MNTNRETIINADDSTMDHTEEVQLTDAAAIYNALEEPYLMEGQSSASKKSDQFVPTDEMVELPGFNFTQNVPAQGAEGGAPEVVPAQGADGEAPEVVPAQGAEGEALEVVPAQGAEGEAQEVVPALEAEGEAPEVPLQEGLSSADVEKPTSHAVQTVDLREAKRPRLMHQPGGPHNAAHRSYGMLDTDADISDWINEIYKPGSADSMTRELGQSSASQKGVCDKPSSADSMTREELEKLFGDDDFDQDVPAPQLSADNSLGSEMPSTAQLQEGMSSTDVEKVTSDAGQIE